MAAVLHTASKSKEKARTETTHVTYSSQKITFISVYLDKFLSLGRITGQTQKYLVHYKT